MPVFLTGRNPHNVAFADLLGSTAPLPNPACASRHNQRLSEGVREPALSGAAERLAARVQAGELDCQARPTAAALGSAPRSHPQSRPDTARQWGAVGSRLLAHGQTARDKAGAVGFEEESHAIDEDSYLRTEPGRSA
jgi:hypothetical protein